MTQTFYQVNGSLSLLIPFLTLPTISYPYRQLTYSEIASTLNPHLFNISTSNFVLSPYVCPKSPYKVPPFPSMWQERHSKQQRVYGDIQVLLNPTNADALEKFLRAYQTYKHQVFGSANPTDISNPFYTWVIKHNLSAWEIKQNIIDLDFDEASRNHTYKDTHNTPALWCFQRMGQTKTVLSDGRIVYIGGEYEDFYDPDFCIYNDVTVVYLNGTINVYNYPKSIFPPTDFHSATLINDQDGEHIIIIGSIGYLNERQHSHTPVYKLNTQNFKMEQLATRNSMGWVHRHSAVLKDNRIVVIGGDVIMNDVSPLLDNIDTWELNLNTLNWKNVTHRDKKWQRFYVKRQDNDELSLWEYKQLDDYLNMDKQKQDKDFNAHINKKIKDYTQRISEKIKQPPNLDSYRRLLIPPIAHETIDMKLDMTDSYDMVLFIEGIKVGYKTNDDCIKVIIEGKLSNDTLELLQQNLRHKLSKVENMACEVVIV